MPTWHPVARRYDITGVEPPMALGWALSHQRENGDGSKRSVNSYAHVVTGYQGNKEPMDNTPTMVLDETCLTNEVYSLSLLGKVKEFVSLTNLKLVLAKEGIWLPSGKRLLVISVYAPQELRGKKMLWDYLVMVICNWDGEVVVMGDFNENDYINLMKNLRFLREKIQKWNYVYKESKKCVTRNLKVEINSLDYVIDKGDSTYLVRFRQPSHQNIRLEMDFVNRLSLDQKDALESEVTNVEWKLIERDVIKAVKWFFLHGSIPNGGNASFITLIPKIPNANMVKDFRPISLIGSVYKIIAKILANRLVTVLGDLVNEIQSAFVADRQILDGPFILNEIVQWCKKMNKQAMVFKVDFEKAYDSVRWDFVEDILRKFGFGDKWKSVIAFKDVGGLGVSSLFALNRDLMFKWVWMFIFQKNTLWARVISALHGDAGKIGKQITSTYPSTWLTIVQEVEALKMQGLDLLSFINPKLGNGLNTSFLDVPWRGDTAFKELAPRIYALESLKGISVAAKLSHGGLDLSLQRKPRGGAEQVQLELLQDLIHGCLLSNSNDRWSWSLDGGGDFTVSSARKAIDNHILPKGTTKTRWIKEVPIKINIHAWKVKNDCFPTRFNMSRRGMDIDSTLCPLCNSMAESSRHLFFSCNFIRDIMLKINRWWEVDHREIDSYDEWLEWLASIRLPMKVKKVFQGICVIVWWYIWNWRNKKIFGHETSPKANIFDEIVSQSFYWIRFRSRVSFNWNEWLKNPNLISL
nr:RNA-directed DNA polymerase, eukaryota [Tanacetum cinerariifolium]